MLTDLSFLAPGRPWPPEAEKERIEGYTANRKLFEADHAEVFKEALGRVIRNADSLGIAPISYELCINYPRLVSVSTAGLLFNEPPGIIAGAETDTQSMTTVRDIADRSNLQEVFYACALDVSRYGTGILYTRRDESGKGIIDITRPDIWFPVVDGANLRHVLQQVLGTSYVINAPRADGGLDTKQYLRVEIHTAGSVEIRDYTLKDGRIGQLLGARVEATGLTNNAIIPVQNMLPSDRVYGLDDYNDIQSLVCELEVRLGQMSKVLDRHTDPTMQGPEDALTDVRREDGSTARVFIPGKYFVNQTGNVQGNLEYITWEAHLEANFAYIDKLIEMIRVISEMGALLADLSDKGGAVPSGAAMRRMMYSAIGKVSRIRNSFTPAIKRALIGAAELSGDDLSKTPIYINWPDILPRDPLEQAQIADLRTGSKQTQSVKRALMSLDGLDEDEAEAELESIRDEQADAMPMLDSFSSRRADEEPPEADDKREGV